MRLKLFFLAALCMVALSVQAQRCVVLNFQVGDNVTEEEVDAVSYEFRSTFNPSCYTVEDKFKVNRVLKELGFNASSMKKEQIRKLGREMTATVVVYGSLSKFMDEYTLDVNVMDVSTGTTLANQNSTFQKSEFRTHTRSVSQGIVSKLCTASPSASSSSSTGTSRKGYVDLGLPSGTLWKSTNESGFYDYDAAVSRYAGQLPSREQWSELKDYCTWKWTGSGYRVTGENGKSIVLPASGNRLCGGSVLGVGSYGYYWSSTPHGSDEVWSINFDSGGVDKYSDYRCSGFSVRLVQD